jgi:hypothetical protein
VSPPSTKHEAPTTCIFFLSNTHDMHVCIHYTGLESVENHRFSAYAVSDMKAPEPHELSATK